MQEAIACYAVASLATIKHQLWELYASIGKSRIIACIGLMALSSKVVKTVHIVVPNAALKRRDESDFGDYWKFSGLEMCVKYHDKLDFKPTKTDLLIVDEADKLVFEDPLKLRGVQKVCATICFTATLPSSKQMALEQRIIDQLGMRMLTYVSKGLVQTETSLEVGVLNVTTDVELATFILEKAQ